MILNYAGKKIFWLIIIRLVIALSILITAILIQLVSSTILPINPLYFLTIIILLSTILYLFLYTKKINENFQIYFQLFIDIMFITSLIYLTGGFQSPFSFLYIIAIITASILLDRKGVVIISGASIVIFGLLVDLMHLKIIPYYDPQKVYVESYPIKTVYYNLFINFLAFLMTAWLSVYLSEKANKSYRDLKEKENKLIQLQQLYQNVVESMPSGLMTLDDYGNITFVNTAGYKILNIEKEETLISTHFDSVFFSVIKFKDLVSQLEHSGFYRIEGSMIINNEKCEIGAVASPLKDLNKNVYGYLIVFQDITNVKLLQEKLRIKDRMAALGEMAAGIAHELRNPLSGIKGSVQLLQSSNTDANAKEILDILLRESNRLNKIIESFLNFAKPPPFFLKQHNLAKVIPEAINFFKRYHQINKNVNINFHSSKGDCLALIDLDQFNQAVWNIIKNSIQAMPSGGLIDISLEDQDKVWKIEFTDNGVGIEPHRLKKIFDPFQPSTTGGSGLGMAIIYRIIKEHSGNIEVFSSPNQGTSIVVTLPKIK